MQLRVQTKSIGDLFEILQNQLRIDKTDSKKILEKVFCVKDTYTVSVCMQFRWAVAKQTQSKHTSQRIDCSYSRVFVELDPSVRLVAILNVTAR